MEQEIKLSSKRKQKVLIVEDNAITSFHMQLVMEMNGYEAHKLNNGEEAIVYAEANPPDIILMDIMLAKGINGIETVKALRETSENTPVIFISALTDTATSRQVKEFDHAYTLIKPFNEDELMQLIKKCLEKAK